MQKLIGYSFQYTSQIFAPGRGEIISDFIPCEVGGMRNTCKTFVVLVQLVIFFILNAFPVEAHAINDAFVIHEVKAGDTLAKIAKRYNQSVSRIKQMNGLTSNRIVPGETLLLPGSRYIINTGETLWKIADRHGVSVQEIMNRNGIRDQYHVLPGTIITLPSRPKINIMTGAYLVPKNGKSDQWLLRNYRPLVSQIGLFEYHPDFTGKLTPVLGKTVIIESWKQQMEPVAVVSNLSAEGFDPQLVHHLLNNSRLRGILVQNISNLLHQYDFKGVNIDFEQVKPQDREAFTSFMRELADKLKPVGYSISIAVPAKQGDRIPEYLAGYDYAALGKIVDHFFLMTYDWHWPGGEPGPIAPITPVRSTLQYAVETVPKEKVFLGIPMYAYDWTLSPNGKTEGRAYSQKQAITIATRHGSRILYEEKSEAPHFFYTDSTGNKHEVWFEDARSIVEKYRLIPEFGIKGMGEWQLGLSFPQAEQMALRMFNIQKP